MLRAKSWASCSSSWVCAQVDDVDPAALGEDVPPHLRIPAPGLVTEMDSGLQQLAHGDDGHGDPFLVAGRTAGRPAWNRQPRPAPPRGSSRRIGDEKRPHPSRFGSYPGRMSPASRPVDPFARLAAEIREASFDLALEAVEEGLRDDTVPSLDRVGRLGQLGDVPIFIGELALQLEDPQPGRMRQGAPLAALARDHARNREALGFAPREIVTEFLLLRRVLWRFVARRAAEFGADEVLEVERRLDDAIDRLVVECVVGYFDRAMGELSLQARQDPLTGLLNHQTFTHALEAEVARAVPLRARPRARLLRRRPLQGGQRHARPPRGRPRAPGRGDDGRRHAAPERRRRAHGRRRSSRSRSWRATRTRAAITWRDSTTRSTSGSRAASCRRGLP